MGFELERVQHGGDPADWKPFASVGVGVREIRVHAEGEYRALYLAQRPEAVYVLHAFRKKDRATSERDINLGRQRLLHIERAQ